MTMQSLNQIVERISNGDLPSLPPERKPVTISENDARVVNTVFDRLQVIFPAWQRAFPTPEALKAARQEWTKALVQAGVVTEQSLAFGFKIARTRDIPFFPSPGQFIDWCKPTPEVFGLPSVEQAFHEVMTRRAKHPAVVLAAKATRRERGELNSSEYMAVFTNAYEQMVRRVMAGEDLNAEIIKALPGKGDVYMPEQNPEKLGRRITGLREMFSGKASKPSQQKDKSTREDY